MARRKKDNRRKILLVDDNHETLEIITHLIKLRDDRVDVLGAPSAEEGMLELSKVDLLVTDLRLPGMGGVDLIKRGRRRNKELPAIIISGLEEVEAQKLIGDVEIVGFVPKPYKPDDLINMILKAVWGDDMPPEPPSGSSAEAEQAEVAEPRSDVFHPPLSKNVISRLEQLQSRTEAHQVILWSLDGTLLYLFDEKERRDVEKLSKLAISSIANGLEMLVRSGSTPTRLMNVLDGEPHEIVLAYVKSKGDYCLAIMLDGGGKLGTVWGAMQRTVVDLAIRLHPDSNKPAEPNEIQQVIKEPAAPAPAPVKKEPEEVVEVNPIASDEDLAQLLEGFSDNDVSDDELDSFWGEEGSAASGSTQSEAVNPPTQEQSKEPEAAIASAEPVPEKQTSVEPEPEPEPVAEASDIPGLEDMLVETNDGVEVLDERWEEVKGMLGLDEDPDQFWEQAIADNLQTSADQGEESKKSGVMSYEEAREKGLLGD